MDKDFINERPIKCQGAQGECSIVESQKDGKDYFKKRMKEGGQKNSERRKRFFYETRILQSLQNDIDGIPKIICTNSAEYKNKDIELYYIAEYIEGQTLTDFINKQNVDESVIITFLKELLVILKNCHLAGIVHRDVKPDNIIINSDGEVFLVDFGIGYMECDNEKSKDITYDSNRLGNSFLSLPELSAFSSIQNKRDPRSDLTFICGVAFFMLFHECPRTLNGYGKYEQPHSRQEISVKLKKLKFRLFWKKIFDMGFCSELSDRWQSADDLLEVLSNMNDERLKEIKDNDTFLQEYSDQINYEKLKKINSTLIKMRDTLRNLCIEIINKYPAFRTETMPWKCDMGSVESKIQIRAYLLQDNPNEKEPVTFNFIIKYNGEGFIGYLEHNSKLNTIFNNGMESILDEHSVTETLKPHIQTALAEFIKAQYETLR